mmetsp:Transcript_54996/g.159199  ORF Transcript_54996/g.159199 Transcript_54996/m.159199 type:complete len:422 (-) Transcript_54996:73-1338(-)
MAAGGGAKARLRDLSDDEKASIEKTLVYGEGLFITAVMMAVPTRAPMVHDILNGDSAATARTMGLMSSAAALLEVFLNPVFGRLSDKYGRKPFLLLAPALDAALHALVAAFPKSLKVNIIDRVITGSMIYCFISPVNAALTDLYGTGPTLTAKMARAQIFFGVGTALGPYLGSKLGGARSFAASAATFSAALWWMWAKFPETLRDDRRKEFHITECSPLRFLALFREKMTATLATTIGLQSFGDIINLLDINFLYLQKVMSFEQAEVGNFATMVGVSQVVNGELMKRFGSQVPRKLLTAAANGLWMAAMMTLGTAKGVKQLAVALSLMAFGHLRAGAVSTYLQHHGQATGMGAAEIEASKANLTAMVKVVVPILYGNVFAWATSNGRNMPGTPYFLIMALTGLSQVVFSSVDPDKKSLRDS